LATKPKVDAPSLSDFMANENALDPRAGAAPAKKDRRQAPRYSANRMAACSPLAERETKVHVRVHDMSANGIGLLSTRRFELGTMLLLQIEEGGNSLPPLIIGRVMHVCAQADGTWLVGCALTRAFEQSDIRDLADEASKEK
jgi:hypothetical protein